MKGTTIRSAKEPPPRRNVVSARWHCRVIWENGTWSDRTIDVEVVRDLAEALSSHDDIRQWVLNRFVLKQTRYRRAIQIIYLGIPEELGAPP